MSAKDQYQVLDLNGNVMFITSETQQVDLSKLPSGVYFLQNSKGFYAKVIKE
jgi:hypothetical protein